MNKPKSIKDPLVNKYFFTFTDDEKKPYHFTDRGRVLSNIKDGYYLVDVYARGAELSTEQVYHLKDMNKWFFFEEYTDWAQHAKQCVHIYKDELRQQA